MKIRLANESDLSQLIAISETADSPTLWTRQHWMDIFGTKVPARVAWIAEEIAEGETQAIGFLVAQNCGVEWELENVVVLPAYLRRGAGRGLLSTLLAYSRSMGAERVLLEVRVSNVSAIALYRQCRFDLMGQRRDYYRKPTEDALILVHTF